MLSLLSHILQDFAVDRTAAVVDAFVVKYNATAGNPS